MTVSLDRISPFYTCWRSRRSKRTFISIHEKKLDSGVLFLLFSSQIDFHDPSERCLEQRSNLADPWVTQIVYTRSKVQSSGATQRQSPSRWHRFYIVCIDIDFDTFYLGPGMSISRIFSIHRTLSKLALYFQSRRFVISFLGGCSSRDASSNDSHYLSSVYFLSLPLSNSDSPPCPSSATHQRFLMIHRYLSTRSYSSPNFVSRGQIMSGEMVGNGWKKKIKKERNGKGRIKSIKRPQ